MALGDSISGTVSLGYLDTAANSQALRAQVRLALATTALTVIGEDPATANHAARLALATAVIRYVSDDQLAAWCRAVVSDAVTIPGAPDTTVLSRVAALWNAFAGS